MQNHKHSSATLAAFNQSFFIVYLALFFLVGIAGMVTVAVFGELGTEYPMPVYGVVLRFAALLLSLVLITAAFIAGSRFLLSQHGRRFDSRRLNTALILLGVGLILTVQLVCAFCLRMKPITDLDRLTTYAARIVSDDSFACLDSDFNNHYIIRYQNNLPILLIITAVCKLSSVFFGGVSDVLLIVLNTLAITSAILLTVLTARRLFGERKALIALMLCAFFTPYYTYAPYYYTDSFSLPFVAGTVYCLAAALQSETRGKKAALLLLSGALCLIGFEIKGSVIILVPALLIYLPLRYGLKRAVKTAGAFLLSFCILYAGCTAGLKASRLISEESSDKYQFPTLHWIMMGLNDKGAFTYDDSDYSESFPTMEERKAGELVKIGERLSDFGALGLAAHLGYKVVWTYMDGTYYIANYLENCRHRTPLHSLVLYDGKFRFAFFAYSFGYQLFLFLMIAYSGRKARREREGSLTTLFRIALIGMLLFFMVWETNARYPFNFTPLYILTATEGVSECAQRLIAKRRKKAA